MATDLRRKLAAVLIAALAAAPPVRAQGNSWNRIRYSGGTVAAKVNPYDWNTVLTVSPDQVVVEIGKRQIVRIPARKVTALSYGLEAHRRVADMVALSFVMTPLALFGLLHRSKNHFVGIEYADADGKPGALLLEADKNNYRSILHVLKAITGQPVRNEPAL